MNAELRYLESLQGSGIRPGLERMRTFLRAAGNPERSAAAILIAGTNGKGSTAATLASILTSAGYRTGLYTSPHLVTIRERWRLDREDAPMPELRSSIRELQRLHAATKTAPTYFEALTILAFLLFRASEREVSVLEVGMGGRLDATNVVRPLASVITPIDFDHTEWLGSSLRAIAREKAGIIHRGSIAVVSEQKPEALETIARRATRAGAPLHRLPREVRLTRLHTERAGVSFTFETDEETFRLRSPLSGEHQVENVALAARTAQLLSRSLGRITPVSIVSGVETTRWRGRLERFELGEGRTVWVDGAHNPHAIRTIAPWVDRHVPRPRTLVFGVLREKNLDEMAAAIVPLFDEVIVTEPDSERAIDARAAAARIESLRGGRRVRAIGDPRRALRAAIEQSPHVVVCGSLYLAGEAIALLDRITPEPHATEPERPAPPRAAGSSRPRRA